MGTFQLKRRPASQRTIPTAAPTGTLARPVLRHEHGVLSLQPSIGNQAVLRLVRSGTEAAARATPALHRAATGGIEAPPIVHDVLREAGQPLDASTRTFMESRFGHDFSHVRVHTDAAAARSARQVHATAYTIDNHIVFAEGRRAASAPEGNRLLAHELAHVIQGRGRNTMLRRQPDSKGAQAEESRLRVTIVERLEATKSSAIDAVASAIRSGDRAYLEGLGLSSKQVDQLLNRTPQFEMTFGTAAELAVEQAVRNDAFLSQYIKRGPQGRVPAGVGKPDWRIETPSSSIPVDLMTGGQVAKKLEMWRAQWKRGKPKWYIEKGLNITYERPPLTAPPTAATAAAQEAAQVAEASGLRIAGRFLAREVPGLILQAALMVLFPPGVNIHSDKAEELSRTKLDPVVRDRLKKQATAIGKLLADDESQSIYANVTATLYYSVDASSSGDLELYLEDIAFLDMKITRDDVRSKEQTFTQTGSRLVTNRVTYSLLLYEPEYITQQKEWEKAQQDYQECLRRYGTGSIPPAAGAEAAQTNPEEGPCIPPHMKPMEGP
jgi:hypothetical protein